MTNNLEQHRETIPALDSVMDLLTFLHGTYPKVEYVKEQMRIIDNHHAAFKADILKVVNKHFPPVFYLIEKEKQDA